MTPMQKQLYIVPFKKLPSTKAWKVTSRFVRVKSKGICYTCGNKFPIEELNCGHFREKIGNAGNYFDLRNLRAQCYRCNRKLSGNKDVFARGLVHEYGPKILDDLFREGQKARVWTLWDLEQITEERSKLLQELENG